MEHAQPCPACGATELEMEMAPTKGLRYHVVCPFCYTAGPIDHHEGNAVSKWNKLTFTGHKLEKWETK